MPVGEGDFVWYELIADDPASACAFYTNVVGWSAADAGIPDIDYTILGVGTRPVAGIMPRPPTMPGGPRWVGHILTADVDATAARVQQAGGQIRRPGTDIPGIGRFAVLTDPQGAGFLLFRADGTPPPDLAPGTPGAIGWHELHTTDWEAAFAFYAELFGWTRSQAVDMGPMGTYQTFSIGEGWVGGMMNNPQASPPFWLFYFNVDDIDAATARVTEAGGTLLREPQQVPGGSWIIHARDPGGAMFALAGPRAP